MTGKPEEEVSPKIREENHGGKQKEKTEDRSADRPDPDPGGESAPCGRVTGKMRQKAGVSGDCSFADGQCGGDHEGSGTGPAGAHIGRGDRAGDEGPGPGPEGDPGGSPEGRRPDGLGVLRAGLSGGGLRSFLGALRDRSEVPPEAFQRYLSGSSECRRKSPGGHLVRRPV